MKLSVDALDWALKNVEAYGDTDIFPLAFEFEAIRHSWDGPNGLKAWLASQDLFLWKTRPYRRCLSPKQRFAFRVATQLDPIDTLVYAALVYEIGTDIENRRVPKRRRIVHSYRFSPTKEGGMYDPKFGYDSFTQKSVDLVRSEKFKYVAVTDIADFFSRLYSHPLENALRDCTKVHRDHATVLKKLLAQWNFTVSHGIPIGPSPSRLLSELAIADVDEALLSAGQTFCRYSDDYRLFCRSKREAHERLALLANTLFENHGLTLQAEKTRVLTVDAFKDSFLSTERAKERHSLTGRFTEILSELGLENPYDEIDYDELDPRLKKMVDALNLQGILTEQFKHDESLNIPITRFVLRRLLQLDNTDCVDQVLNNIEKLYPLMKETLEYLTRIKLSDSNLRHRIGGKLLRLVDKSLVGHLEYHRCWIFNTFSRDTQWDHASELGTLYDSHPDVFSRRELVLALGRSRSQHWFKARKRAVFTLEPWERRAFLAAASCLPGDESDHWYRSVSPKVDELENAIIEWAKSSRFG